LKRHANNNINLNPNLSKSSSNLYNGTSGTSTSTTTTSNTNNSIYPLESPLRPVPRVCTIYKTDHSLNIGFGIATKPSSIYSTVIPPQYMRVSIVNYKSPAYVSGLEAGDIIVEVRYMMHFSSIKSNNEPLKLKIQKFLKGQWKIDTANVARRGSSFH
jgi:hypothetical protein